MTDFETLSLENPVFKTIINRRSIRHYKKDDVPNEIIENLVKAANWSPSAHNTQTWRFVVVRDEVVRRDIAEKIYYADKDQPFSFDETKPFYGLNAPVQIFVFNDIRKVEDPDLAKDTVINCYAAVQNFLLAAASLGLGTCWLGAPLKIHKEINDILNIPEGLYFTSSIALGYPDEKPSPPPRENELSEILFYEKM